MIILRKSSNTHTDTIFEKNMDYKSEEIGYAPEMSATACCYLAQVYLLTKNAKYLNLMDRQLAFVLSFCGRKWMY